MLTLHKPVAYLLTAALAIACGGNSGSSGGATAQQAQDGSLKPKTATEADETTGTQKPERAGTADSKDTAVAACKAFIADQKIDTSVPGWKGRLNQPPKFSFDEDSEYLWHLNTNKGEITIKLWPDVAPMHVSSTMYLTMAGFYDDVVFHRVIPGFMAQGGDPTGTGSGGPGYKYAGEFKSTVRHDRPFLLSMANAGPGTDGSQFFLTFVPTPHLDGKHTLFGEIIAGGETMRALEQAGSRTGKTSEPLVIESATLEVQAKSAD